MIDSDPKIRNKKETDDATAQFCPRKLDFQSAIVRLAPYLGEFAVKEG